MKAFFSKGKLLLTGEYVVLDGALSLALPTKLGQSLQVKLSSKCGVSWKSIGYDHKVWFQEKLFTQSTNPIAQTLEKILTSAQKINPHFVFNSVEVETFLDFPNHWGLGSSSTLINSIAQWAEINPYQLLFESFGGSGYDIACAQANSPLLYRLERNMPQSYPIYFRPSFCDKLFFVHLNKKQNSRDAIARYKQQKINQHVIAQITEITENLLRNPSFEDFGNLMQEHENIISQFLNLPKVKEEYFMDFEGIVKSLGAWGGDFVLVAGEQEYIQNYFSTKGFNTILSFNDLIVEQNMVVL